MKPNLSAHAFPALPRLVLWYRRHQRRALPALVVMLATLAALLYMKWAMASTFTVTSTADTGGSTCSGTCTLRQAINAVNAAGPGPHTINFNIPSCTSGCTITVPAGSLLFPSNPLPALTRPVTINGTSQPGYSGTPLIRIDGEIYSFFLSTYTVDTGLILAAGSSGSTIRGLAFTNFQYVGVIVDSSNNVIAGNYVGVTHSGNTAASNATGIWLSSGSGNTVGGTTAADRNVISGNYFSGVYVTSSSNTVVGNYIGVGANGSTALGNGNSGVWIASNVSDSKVGGTAAGAGNVIVDNVGDGITLLSGSGVNNSMLGNSIYSNGSRGIDFDDNGVTNNDLGDGDTGVNGRQNFPVVSTATTNGSTTTVSGSLNTNASTTYRLEFFSSVTGDGTGYGEGQFYLGSTTVTTDGSGNATYTATLPVGTTAGYRVSATATIDLGGGNYGSTSEFAQNATATLTPVGVTVGTISGNTTEAGGTATFTVVLDRAPTATVTIPVSSNNVLEGTVSTSSLSFTTGNWSTPQTVTVTGVDETIVDGNRAYNIVLGNASSADGAYNGLNPADVSATNIDNDTQSTIVVTTSSDVIDGTTTSLYALLSNQGADGFISLREAITAANNSANGPGGPDIINFAVGTGSFSIGLGSTLPALSQPTIINGWSQPGYTFGPLVIIDCNQLSWYGVWLLAGAGGSTVRGLVVRDCAVNAIRIESGSNGNTIHGNYLGSFDAAGTDQGVGERNTSAGIFIAGANNFIGGGGTAQGNVIGGNQSHGVHISGAAATGNRVQGNYVGLNAAGAAAVANTSDGIRVDGSGNVIGTNLDGSNDATEGNVVSGNGGGGIIVRANNTTVQGNFVGLLPDGATKVGNGGYGINVWAFRTGATIGSSTAGGGNVVSGNGNAGILFEIGSSGTVKGNLVGTASSGSSVITGNGAGIYIASANVQVGGTTTAEGNTVAGSNTHGIIVAGATATGNAILGNRIHSNSGLGIDLNNNGVTGNDTGDADTGPNNLQNFPVLSTAVVSISGTQITVTGTLNSTAATPFRVEFFANSAGDVSGHGEGQRYLGHTDVTTDGSGSVPISALLTATVTPGEFISATATKSNVGFSTFTDTSEFSAHIVATSAGYSVSGRVFEDINYGGGAGRTQAASSGVGISGATVELYSPESGLVATTTTNGSGDYSFATVVNGGYFVRVVQSSVNSMRTGAVPGLLGVQTWRYEASWLTPGAVDDEVGGARPDTADSGAAAALSWSACASEGGTCTFTGTRLIRYGVSPNYTTRVATGSVACNSATFNDPAVGLSKTCSVLQPNLHSASSLHVAGAAVSGVDFGFNFSTVVNTNHSGQGSLRQAITNANTLSNVGLAQSGRTAGIENLVFMISNGSGAAGLRSSNNYFSSGVASIAPTAALPSVTDALVLDAQTQPGWALAPIVELNGTSAGGGVSGLTLNAAATVLRGFVINRFGAEGVLSTSGAGLVIQGNHIGTNADGTAALGNHAAGILIYGTVSNSTIGGTLAGAANLIRSNGDAGIVVAAGATGIAMLGNSIHGNTGLGIDLNGNGVTTNDGAKTPGAGNQLMDHPVFTNARARGNQLTVAGHVGSAPGQASFANARVEIFASDQDSSGYGEGRTYLGFVTTDASGNFSSTITMTQSRLAVGTRLTGTATDAANNTSEFGANFAGLIVDLVVNHNGDAADASPGNGVCETATPGQCTLRAALAEVNALGVQPGALTIAFDLPACTAAGQAACIITPTTALPAATQAVVVDGQTQPGWTLTPFVELVGSSAPAGTTGLAITGAGSTVRGLVVGGFNKAGISINANNALVQGNVIGLQGNGSTARGNGDGGTSAGGIWIIGGTGTVIGGNTAAQRNVVSGNASPGVYFSGGTVSVKGNYIGTNAAGTAGVSNGLAGLHVAGGSGHVIGGAAAGEGNVISGNAAANASGVLGYGVPLVIQGNLIGTNAAGTAYIPNGDAGSTWSAGIDLRFGSGHVIGGTAPGEANTIAGNQGHGIRVATQTNRILGNRIYDNLWRGIDLNGDGVTANDGLTNGAQPNNGMDHPVFTGAGVANNGLSITVMGYIGTGSGQAVFAGATVQIFKALNDGSGYGQGQTHLGDLIADSNGRFSGTLTIPFGDAVVGDPITATATDAAGNTSEFGPNWISTTIAGLSPASFNAFESDTAPGALTGVLRSKIAGSAATVAVLALDSAGTAPHPGFTGTVQLRWLDARDDSGAISGSCRASWLDLGAAGSASFSTENRVDVSVTPPATSTRAMRLQVTYVGPGGTVVACSNDAFAGLPAQLAWIGASDTHSALAGTVRTLDNTAVSGGVVHNAGRPFTLRAQALSALGTLMTAYDGTPALAISNCVLPVGCTAGTLGGSSATAAAGVYRNDTVTYAEVGAIGVQLTDTGYASVDAGDTTLGARTFGSGTLQVGRFVPDYFLMTVSTSGVLATANAACMASGSAATFMGQGFGWATAPQATLTARNAAGLTTTMWTGTLMKLSPGAGLAPTLSATGTGTATLAPSYGAISLADLGNGQVRLTANALDRFVLDVPVGAPQATVAPTWQWQLNVSDTSEGGVSGNGTPASVVTQSGVPFDQGGSFHSGRLTLSAAHGDARSGVRMLMALQRYTNAGWVTLTEDRGCVTVQRAHIELSNGSGAFAGNLCAAPLAASATTAGGRAWLSMPATPAGATGRVSVRVAGTAASGSACSPTGTVQAVSSAGLPWLTGGASGAGPTARATWGSPSRDLVLRREIW